MPNPNSASAASPCNEVRNRLDALTNQFQYLVHVNGENMDQRRYHEDVEEREVEDVPE